MDNQKFLNRFRIASARAQWHAYDGGEFFVTICTAKHKTYFGEIVNGEMQMSAIGRFVSDNLQQVTIHYLYADIPVFSVMPNHLHAIVIIDKNKIPTNTRRDVARRVSTDGNGTANESGIKTTTETGKNEKMQDIANQSGWLSVSIGGIKSAVTKFAHENKLDFGWHPRFHDHIIRGADEMDRITQYIENNIVNWKSDIDNIDL